MRDMRPSNSKICFTRVSSIGKRQQRTRRNLRQNYTFLKPWPNGLASRRKFLTCVQLVFRLATTCVDFGRAQIPTQAATQVLHRLATQRKSTQVYHKSSVYA